MAKLSLKSEGFSFNLAGMKKGTSGCGAIIVTNDQRPLAAGPLPCLLATLSLICAGSAGSALVLTEVEWNGLGCKVPAVTFEQRAPDNST